MTAITIAANSTIPTNVNELNKLFLWVSIASHNLYANETYKLSNEKPVQPLIQLANGYAADGKYYFFINAAIPVSANWLTDSEGLKPWNYAQAYNTTAINSAMSQS